MVVITTRRGKRRALPDWAVIKLKPYVRCAGGVTATGEVCGLPEGQREVYRKEHSVATSGKLLAFRECVKRKRKGKKFDSVEESREHFAKVASECKAELGMKPARAPRAAARARVGARRRFPEIDLDEDIDF